MAEYEHRRGFHGSLTHGLSRIEPQPPEKQNYDESSDDMVNYVSQSPNRRNGERGGWAWANRAASKTVSGPTPRPVVYEVVADEEYPDSDWNVHDDMTPEDVVEAGGNPSMQTTGATVTRTHWTPPPAQGTSGVQGTLPNINWQQFGAPNWVELP